MRGSYFICHKHCMTRQLYYVQISFTRLQSLSQLIASLYQS